MGLFSRYQQRSGPEMQSGATIPNFDFRIGIDPADFTREVLGILIAHEAEIVATFERQTDQTINREGFTAYFEHLHDQMVPSQYAWRAAFNMGGQKAVIFGSGKSNFCMLLHSLLRPVFGNQGMTEYAEQLEQAFFHIREFPLCSASASSYR